MTSLQGFELFSQLPVELRELIWQAALPATRVVHLGAYPVEPDDEADEREQLLYEEDLYGKCVENEDTRSVPEKDMRLLVHRTGQCLDGVIKRQSQLANYGFMSNRRTPYISHVSFHDPATYRGFGEYEPNSPPPNRDVRPLLHIRDYPLFGRRNVTQAQLHRYGFKTSRPHPTISHVSPHVYCSTQTAVGIENYGSYGSFPLLMHVCRESRHQAIRSGYVLAFSTEWAPAQTWFNFKTDILHVGYSEYMEYFPEVHIMDRTPFTRLAMNFCRSEPSEEVFDLVESFGNLEELAIVVGDTGPSFEPECLVDCTTADILSGISDYSQFHAIIHLSHVRTYIKAHPTGPLFFDHLIGKMESYLRGKLEVLSEQMDPYFTIPKIRFVTLTDEQGKRDLEAFRIRYWGEREESPAEEDWEGFLREDMDARPPSLFDVQHADDLEAEYDLIQNSYNHY